MIVATVRHVMRQSAPHGSSASTTRQVVLLRALTLRRAFSTVAALLFAATSATAQRGNERDSTSAANDASVVTRGRIPWLTGRDALALGGSVAATVMLAPLDRPISHEFDEPHWRESRVMHHLAGDLAFLGGDGPFVASAMIFAAGSVNGAFGLQRFALHNMEAIALATAIAGVGKGIAGRALPGVNARHEFELGRGFHEGNGPFVSFPSGHTAAAFAMAATVSGELAATGSPRAAMIGRLAFGAAGAVGVARVVQRVHWPSDLPLAVVIGTWSGNAVQAHANDAGRIGAILRGLTITRGAGRLTQLGWSSLAGGDLWR